MPPNSAHSWCATWHGGLRSGLTAPIVSVDGTDAIDLLHAVLSPGIIRVDRPADAVRFGEALEGAGLFGQELCDEMDLGCWPTVDPGRQVFAMASHAWG